MIANNTTFDTRFFLRSTFTMSKSCGSDFTRRTMEPRKAKSLQLDDTDLFSKYLLHELAYGILGEIQRSSRAGNGFTENNVLASVSIS